ncbi:PREDICTED: uncharacterized protein LOC101307945 [Fragaria vesca subsp. vesca]|uniref:uncharacterized protein LOC101307945 n=1 Tax=Fragaria vesca subsp. vesca TaxID=101020 RepID=UPI0002C32637|nr:PREDICTED: uncharacterized protein LOC101307945 [Fragaria vesca subsp. vesca]
MTTSNSKTITVKLLVDKRNQNVLFAEAGKDFVDFLFALLSFPVGTVVRLLSKNGMVGSLGKLYESFENLNDMYMQPNLKRDILLKPKESADVPNNLGLLTNLESPNTRIYYCSRRHDVPYVSHDHNATCPNCYNKLGYQASYVPTVSTPITKTDGFVKGVVTYIVTDELEVKPNFTIASILQLEKFNVKCICDLEEKNVEVSMDEGVKLLKESLQSRSVLTNVFLRGIQLEDVKSQVGNN